MFVFPDDWGKSREAPRKKKKLDATGANDSGSGDLEVGTIECDELPPAVLQIINNIHSTRLSPAIPAELDLDVILSQVPFMQSLCSLFHSDSIKEEPDVPVVSKVFEESYMREPHRDERPCVCGSLCECNFIDERTPFIGVEFLLPGQELPDTPQMCVLCSRKVTQKLFYDIVFAGKQHQGCIQRYGNICHTPGEYARECVLVCPSHIPYCCMPFPVMSHQRNKYEVYMKNGVRCIRQLRVAYEDFHNPLTKE